MADFRGEAEPFDRLGDPQLVHGSAQRDLISHEQFGAIDRPSFERDAGRMGQRLDDFSGDAFQGSLSGRRCKTLPARTIKRQAPVASATRPHWFNRTMS